MHIHTYTYTMYYTYTVTYIHIHIHMHMHIHIHIHCHIHLGTPKATAIKTIGFRHNPQVLHSFKNHPFDTFIATRRTGTGTAADKASNDVGPVITVQRSNYGDERLNE